MLRTLILSYFSELYFILFFIVITFFLLFSLDFLPFSFIVYPSITISTLLIHFKPTCSDMSALLTGADVFKRWYSPQIAYLLIV